MTCDVKVQGVEAVIELMAVGEVLFENEIYSPNSKFTVKRTVSFVAKHVSVRSMTDAQDKVVAMRDEIREALQDYLDEKVSGLMMTVTVVGLPSPQDWQFTLSKSPREASWNKFANITASI